MDSIKEVKKARKGNAAAFERLIIEHQVMMYRVAKTILPKDEDCADAIQETILKAYEKLPTLREPAYFKTWLMRILMNESYQILRQRKKIVVLEEWGEQSSDDVGYEKIEIMELLETLPEEQCQLLKLFYIEGFSIEDLASIYKVPENTIKTRLRRAREKMRTIMTKEKEEKTTWKNGKTK
ncbi:RNA polymerase sigma factor [Evansella cellulosilytica]|uniref:RNA polymerase, sigma-24 subunit, ECF subfamily n=1 Tax=Evansella cellulosilytica (strain ATCC 21833 / DSM 2522 / FERM P-1141 / JCM 9156 / N-4) TaxID=649639 RepID=E6TUT6_EVAC2|nr:sigma-70 family RNA polymerase sigma factor [Evansella cellulosilytica]ADU32088.1 RNA polymerase, sigma-24 subunit, ECF subfamily [Evansella cellulosilytica DSM 2522]